VRRVVRSESRDAVDQRSRWHCAVEQELNEPAVIVAHCKQRHKNIFVAGDSLKMKLSETITEKHSRILTKIGINLLIGR
jgi:hypothetical protein